VQNKSFLSKRVFKKTAVSCESFKYIDQVPMMQDDIPDIKLKDTGEVKRIVFIDRLTIQWQCGGLFISPASNAYNNSSRVMFVCEYAIIFYDFLSKISHMVTSSDLKNQPTSAEFIFPDLCAIGCSDGMIRYRKLSACMYL
jgi:hypothetical protein